MKNVILRILILSLLMANVVRAAPAPIDFNQVQLIKAVKPSIDYPMSLFKSTVAGADHDNKFFMARSMLRLTNAPLSALDQKGIRNEICASQQLYVLGGGMRPGIGSLGIYVNYPYVFSISDTGLSGRSLDSVLRELAQSPNDQNLTDDKVYIAAYYAAAILRTLEVLEGTNLIWNKFDTHNFVVRPDGLLSAFDFSEAISDPMTSNDDKQAQRNVFIKEIVPKILLLLFGDANMANREYNALVSVPIAGAPGGAYVVDSNGARNKPNWTLNELKAMLTARMGAGALGPATNPNNRFGGRLTANVAQNEALLVNDFNNNIAPLLLRENQKPYIMPRVSNIIPGDLTGATPALTGLAPAVNFSIDAATLALLINPATGLAYADLATLCNGWTGR